MTAILLTVEEAAVAFGVSRNTIWRSIAKRKLRHVRLGTRAIRVRISDTPLAQLDQAALVAKLDEIEAVAAQRAEVRRGQVRRAVARFEARQRMEGA